MGMDREGDVFKRSAHLDGQAELGNHVGSFDARDVGAEHEAAVFVGDDFDEAFSSVQGKRASIRREREFADLDVVAFVLGFLLGQADACAFRIGEAYRRHALVVDFARLSADDFSRDAAFIHRFVGKRRTGNDIADSEDMRNVRASFVVDFDKAAVRHLDVDEIKAKLSVRVRTASDRYEQVVGRDFLFLVADRVRNGDVLVGLLGAFRHRAGDDVGFFGFELFRHELGHVFVEAGQDGIGSFENRHLRAELAVHLAQLDADVAAADDDEALRNLRQRQSARGGHDASAERECLQLDRTGARRDDAVLEPVARRFLIVEDTGFVFVDEHDFAGKVLDFVRFQQAGYAAGQLLDDAAAELLDLGPVDLHVGGRNADRFGMAYRVELMGSRDQSLGRNAADVQADAAYIFLIYAEHALAELSGADRRYISAWAGTNYQCIDIERWISYYHELYLHNEQLRIAQKLFNVVKEILSRRTVDDAVVEAEGQSHDGSRNDLAVLDDRLVGNAAYAKDRDFREVDDRREEHAAGGADVRDRDRAAFELGAGKLAVAAADSQVADGIGDRPDVFAVGMLDDRYDEAVVGIRRNADVVIFAEHDFLGLLIQHRIHDRELAASRYECFHDERQVSELDAFFSRRRASLFGEARPERSRRLHPSA
ncbi:hypothetical protein BN871_CL_00110 [Paenibacillus sp. P22]|nr:hypothetical protein BN871_CL_00110 [Paenibacillus sp. P22]